MIRMLIVDDERIDREGIAYLVGRYELPIETRMADSATQAMRILESEPVDILFTDICMPDQNGIELISQAKSRQPSLECIVYSAYGEFEYAQKAMQYGVRHYLLKPMKLEEFCRVMEAVLEDCNEKRRSIRQERLLRLLLLGEVPPGTCDVTGQILLVDLSAPLFADEPCVAERVLIEQLAPTLYVNLNEYQAIVFADRVEEEAIAGFLEKTGQNGTVVTVVKGGTVSGYEDILSTYARMEARLDAKFFSRDSRILDAAANPEADGQYHLQRLSDIETYIDRNEKLRAIAETELLFADLERAGSLSPMYVKYLCSNLVHHCTGVNRQLTTAAISDYVNRLFQCANIYALKDMMTAILDELLPDTEEGHSTIRRVLEIVEQEYMKDISLEQIADRVQLSPSYLSFYFKKETGRNFIKYLTVYRLEKAKELLRTTDIKVITISEMVGYLNSSYFCLLFKNYTGQTPARFREDVSC